MTQGQCGCLRLGSKYFLLIYNIYIYIYNIYIYIYYYLKQHYTTFEKIFWSRSNFHFEDPIFRGAIHRTKKMKVAPWELNPSWLFLNFLFRYNDIYIIYNIYIYKIHKIYIYIIYMYLVDTIPEIWVPWLSKGVPE